ncbi:FAD-binding oxidoreductase [Chitinilyticum litopenaei]|uniref:FAD-binding oxidoreductase n=1 Tax=Chitinilyticum litopenaei TaxID=1121276 RepID=UPI00041030EB|nr:FAD-binding oxidoreductase [Chitinilyticum litopenaei]
MSADFLAALAALTDAAGVLTGSAMDGYLLDQRRRYQGKALAVVRPRTTAEVSATLALCHQHRIPVVPQGGNTSLCGAATPDDSGRAIVLSLSRMTGIEQLDPDNNTITVAAGSTLAAVQQAARAAGRLFPADWAAAASCQIGGALATNAGGINVLRYGNMRDLTLGLEVVLADGTVWNGLRGLRKDNTGYDLKQLFIGSEGTLGVITRAVLRLYPRPTAHATALVHVAHPRAALELLRGLQASVGDRITSFELISAPCMTLLARHCPQLPQPFQPAPEWMVLVELADGGDSDALTERLVEALVTLGFEDALLAQNPSQSAAFWALRESIPEAQRLEGVSIKHDISVPISSIPDFLDECGAALQAAYPNILIIAFGHLGDGNLHYNLFLPDHSNAVYAEEERINAIVYAQVARRQGSFSAEHGVGQLKRHLLARYRDPVEIALMRQLKQALDPQNLLNPCKVLP